MLKSVRVCDRCGHPFTDREEKELCVKKTSRDKSRNIYRAERIDLCPDCYSALMKFMYGESYE